MSNLSQHSTPFTKRSGHISPRRIASPHRAISPRCISPRNSRISSPVPFRVSSPNRSLFIRPNSISKLSKPAYKRIQSEMSIKLLMLPSFIQVKECDILKYTSSISLSRTHIDNQNESRVLKPCRNNGEYTRNRVSLNTDVMRLVFDKNLTNEEVLLAVGKYSLTRGDLRCFSPEKELSDLAIDTCLKCVKYKNMRMLKKGKIKSSICCLSTRFCKFATQKNSNLPNRSKKNLLEYDNVIFPIFVGYWTVMILNTKLKCAKYYDPIGIEKKDDVIFDQLLALLKREIKHHENKNIENTRWMRLEFEKINEREAYVSYDSGPYVIRQVFRVATNKDIKIHPELLTEYRSSLVIQLFKYGNKITY